MRESIPPIPTVPPTSTTRPHLMTARAAPARDNRRNAVVAGNNGTPAQNAATGNQRDHPGRGPGGNSPAVLSPSSG